MDKDYNDFVARMGSFNMNLDDNSDELNHYGKLGMHWGQRHALKDAKNVRNAGLRKAAAEYETKQSKLKTDDLDGLVRITNEHNVKAKAVGDTYRKNRENIIKNAKADKAWEKSMSDQKKSKALLDKVQNDPQHRKEVTEAIQQLQKSGLRGQPLQEAAHYAVMEKINTRLLADPASYNPSKTKVMMMMNVATPLGTAARPMVVDVNSIEDVPKFRHGDYLEGDYLMHYGILGMHWGRRKGTTSSPKPSLFKSHKKEIIPSEEHLKKVEIRKKKVHEMTNAELKAVNERMQLEKTYKELSASQLSQGRRQMNKIITQVGTQTVTNMANQVIKTGIEAAGAAIVANVAKEAATKALLKQAVRL